MKEIMLPSPNKKKAQHSNVCNLKCFYLNPTLFLVYRIVAAVAYMYLNIIVACRLEPIHCFWFKLTQHNCCCCCIHVSPPAKIISH
jgi:hypothetical protein